MWLIFLAEGIKVRVQIFKLLTFQFNLLQLNLLFHGLILGFLRFGSWRYDLDLEIALILNLLKWGLLRCLQDGSAPFLPPLLVERGRQVLEGLHGREYLGKLFALGDAPANFFSVDPRGGQVPQVRI